MNVLEESCEKPLFSLAASKQVFSIGREGILSREACPLCNAHERKLIYTKYSPLVKEPAEIFKCRNCAFVYSGVLLLPEAAKAFYERKYLDGNYVLYSAHSSLKIKNFAAKICNLTRLAKLEGRKLLDLGCGEGLSMQAANDFGYTVTGVEISEKAVQSARMKNIGSVICSDLSQLSEHSLPSDFDAITLFDVLDHVANPKEVLIEAHKHLRKGGAIYADVTNIESVYAHIMRKHYTHIIPYEHLSYFSKETLADLFKSLGFKTIEVAVDYRSISYDFLVETLVHFNPFLSRILRCIGGVLPRRLKSMGIPISVGVFSVIAIKE